MHVTDIIEIFISLFYIFIKSGFNRNRKKTTKKNIDNMISLSKKDYAIEKILDSKTKLFNEPKKSIFYLNLEKDQKITIFGEKMINGIKWNKVLTENGDKGWIV